MTALYSVTIAFGDAGAYAPVRTWTLEHQPRTATGRVQVTDGVRILEGLRFSWSTPDDGLYPYQPDAMTAALALTMPTFDDAPWMVEGAPVRITVDVAGVQKFGFWGRLTDASAVPRPDRPGVTLSIAAIDYTIDPGEWDVSDEVITNGGWDNDVLSALFDVTDLGDFPTWPTAAGTVLVPNVLDVRGSIDQILLTTCVSPGDGPAQPSEWGPDDDMVRLIFAPQIDPATGRPPAIGPRWAFDPVWKNNPAPPLTIDNRLERASLTWARNKRTQPSKVTATGPDGGSGETTLTATNPFGARLWGPEVTATIDTVSTDGARVDQVLSFYLPSLPERGWGISTLRWHITRGDDDEVADLLEALPLNLFPRWDLEEGDPDRAAYCQRLVELVNVSDDVNPYVNDSPRIVAPLAGCALTIQGGHIALDLTLRRLIRQNE